MYSPLIAVAVAEHHRDLIEAAERERVMAQLKCFRQHRRDAASRHR